MPNVLDCLTFRTEDADAGERTFATGGMHAMHANCNILFQLRGRQQARICGLASERTFSGKKQNKTKQNYAPQTKFSDGPFPSQSAVKRKGEKWLHAWSPLTQVAPTLLALTGSVQHHRLRSLRYPEDSCKREFAHGLRPTSQRLNQWCFVGTTNHDLCHPQKRKTRKSSFGERKKVAA
jgi:hypothetical protein